MYIIIHVFFLYILCTLYILISLCTNNTKLYNIDISEVMRNLMYDECNFEHLLSF